MASFKNRRGRDRETQETTKMLEEPLRWNEAVEELLEDIQGASIDIRKGT